MDGLRAKIRQAKHRSEAECLADILAAADFSPQVLDAFHQTATGLVRDIRDSSDPTIMELFLGEYGLSSDEGVALMCLAEALLRVPDAETMTKLIEDKVAPSAWGAHLGKSHSSLVNASTWALFMTGKVLSDDKNGSVASTLHGAVKRLGEPVIRNAVQVAMKEMGRQFVLGETIEKAMARAKGMEAKGYTYSYDMLGEAAKTDADAKRYHMSYADAIIEIGKAATADRIQDNPSISIKLSALHPRYEMLQRDRVMAELLPRARSLAVLAKSAGIGLNIDAEEAARLDLSLDVIEALMSETALDGWDGFGVVVQAYSKRAPFVIDWLYGLAEKLDRKIMVRLVKGAYWDTEIKLAQVEGLDGFPVFTAKPTTDVSYLGCAKKLLGMTDRIYPQFATHNAHSMAAILEMSEGKSIYEFQRLHGMGETLHGLVLSRHETRCRVYAPVGAHKDLLAYLVRRLLENGANSSFVNQIVDETVPPEVVAKDPVAMAQAYLDAPENPAIAAPIDIFGASRSNSLGWDLDDPLVLKELEAGLAAARNKPYLAQHLTGQLRPVTNPATGSAIGKASFASDKDAGKIVDEVGPWGDTTPQTRAAILNRAADLYEEHSVAFFNLLIQEAGKTIRDCVGELREAVDFLRFYATEAVRHDAKAIGVFTCISPWNFPLAIFTGQISAALAAGNGVIAKPAEATPLIADYAVDLLYQAGVPKGVLRLVAGDGPIVGPVLTGHEKVDGVCFTGSTPTAQAINRTMAENLSPGAPLIAETGGINAMIVDSTALPEQAVTDIVASAFQSAGQRCSALRVLYLQDDVADGVLQMLFGAMDALSVGDPCQLGIDVGPVVDQAAQTKIAGHVAKAAAEGRLLKQLAAPEQGTFVGPAVVAVNGIADVAEEIFGPVLHVARFKPGELNQVIQAINGSGYGLTFGLHTRIDDRVQHLIDTIKAGNIYVNRNQIGAVVGSQPFGGHGLSGTGPKAGGPRYLAKFSDGFVSSTSAATPQDLPGPTGESNRYSLAARSEIYCLGPTPEMADAQAEYARGLGCVGVHVAPQMDPDQLADLPDIGAALYWGQDGAAYRRALAGRPGKIVPLITAPDRSEDLIDEVVICIDTTASGGNAALLGA